MIVVLVAAAVIVLLAVVGSYGSAHSRRSDETERFHRAANLTSQWARAQSRERESVSS